MPESTVDVNELRKQALEDLKKKVDYAFDHRDIDDNLNADGTASLDEIEKDEEIARKISEKLKNGVRPEDIEITYKGLVKDNEVYVENPHDYRDLLFLAIKKAVEVSKATLDDDSIYKIIDGILEHEFAHAVGAIGMEGFEKIRYKVSIADNKVGGGINIKPSIGLKGTSNLWVFVDIVSGPKDPSPTDLAKTSGLDLETLEKMFLQEKV